MLDTTATLPSPTSATLYRILRDGEEGEDVLDGRDRKGKD